MRVRYVHLTPVETWTMQMESFLEITKQVVIVVSVFGVVMYAGLLLGYALGNKRAKDILGRGNPSFMFGLPISAAIAFAIVCVFETVAPGTAAAADGGKLSFTAFGAAFTGPAGPTTLWVVCYLTLVASMRILNGASGSAAKTQAD
jgi:hypothetical protein